MPDLEPVSFNRLNLGIPTKRCLTPPIFFYTVGVQNIRGSVFYLPSHNYTKTFWKSVNY